MTLPKRTAGMVLATMAVITTASMVSGHNAPATRSATASQPVGEPTIKGAWLTRVNPGTTPQLCNG